MVESVDDQKVCGQSIFSYVPSTSFLSGFIVHSHSRHLLISSPLVMVSF
jgi:hypothetical protein